jgi:hypothetical protein
MGGRLSPLARVVRMRASVCGDMARGAVVVVGVDTTGGVEFLDGLLGHVVVAVVVDVVAAGSVGGAVGLFNMAPTISMSFFR